MAVRLLPTSARLCPVMPAFMPGIHAFFVLSTDEDLSFVIRGLDPRIHVFPFQ